MTARDRSQRPSSGELDLILSDSGQLLERFKQGGDIRAAFEENYFGHRDGWIRAGPRRWYR